jgi:hypothetical protein
VLVAALYSLGAHGIMTLNDFKSMEGDRRTRAACQGIPQAASAATTTTCGAAMTRQARRAARPLVAALLAGQGVLMRRFLSDPHRWAAWYNGTGTLRQRRDDHDLRRRHDEAGEAGGAAGAELDRQRADAGGGLCYEGLPWFTGTAVMAGALPDGRIVLVAALYSPRRCR